MKLLWIADVRGWVFDRIGQNLQKYGEFDYDVRYGRHVGYNKVFKNIDKYDLILYPVDVRPDYVMKAKIPPHKLVMFIRSDVFNLCKPSRLVYYNETKLMKRKVRAFVCANHDLHRKFLSKYDIDCFYAPGGVDTDVFKPALGCGEKRVGWAGSRDNFGKKTRGLHLIEEACKKIGYKWNPAYREVRWRNQEEMVAYYQDEIDIFVDAFTSPGRQNGLLEAGACGKALVTVRQGIGADLIDAGASVEIERNVDSIAEGLKKANKNWFDLTVKAQKLIKEKWSWKEHVRKWEKIFKSLT